MCMQILKMHHYNAFIKSGLTLFEEYCVAKHREGEGLLLLWVKSNEECGVSVQLIYVSLIRKKYMAEE